MIQLAFVILGILAVTGSISLHTLGIWILILTAVWIVFNIIEELS